MATSELGDVSERNLDSIGFVEAHSKVTLTREKKQYEGPHVEHAHQSYKERERERERER